MMLIAVMPSAFVRGIPQGVVEFALVAARGRKTITIIAIVEGAIVQRFEGRRRLRNT
jgi:hypothetical protein